MGERTVELEVGAVVLTPGFEEFDASRKGEFGHGRYANVLTSVEFERMLSAAGPFEGHIVRLSDRQEAKKVAWIQCVGSRDSKCGNEYCSSICCMASTKQAMVAQDHTAGLEATIFYMDIRAHGKDFDQYYERAKNQNGVRYIKSIPSRIVQMPGTMNPRVRFLDESGKLSEEEFDLVVLSVGLEPSKSAVQCAKQLGIELNDYGFCATDRSAPLSTSRPGVFVGGAFQEPKDIPETVMQASGAASMAMELLASARNTRTVKKKYPEEHDVTDESPRIGVFVCHCGRNIGSVVDVENVVKAIEGLPNVVYATHTMFTCSDTSLSNIRDKIREHRLNRIVVASCTPRTHEPLFRETMREAGLNPYLFEMANIRDQCSWVHSATPEIATQKSVELVKMAVARAELLSSLEPGTLAVDQKGLVIGGGLSGMTAALSLANQGFKVHLVERTERLGGHLHDIHFTLEETDVAGMTADLIQQVQNHKNIDVYLSADVADVKGHIGEFHATLSQGGKKLEVTSGTVIVATGAERAETTKFLGGASPSVITQVELEKRICENKLPAGTKNVVMIQCAGSRDDERAYCSRICCSMAVKNALAIKKKSPDTNVFVLYRDIRTYGFRELYYKQAREAGVVFIRYTREQEPVVSETGGLKVSLTSPDFPEPLVIETRSGRPEHGRRGGPGEQQTRLRHAQGAAERGRLLRRGPHEAAAGRFRDRGHLPVRPGPLAQVHGREHRPGARDRRPCGDGPLEDAPGRQSAGLVRRSEQVHLVHDLRARLPVRGAVLQQRRQRPDRGRQVHGLRHLRVRVSGPRDSTEPLPDGPVPRDDPAIVRRRERDVEKENAGQGMTAETGIDGEYETRRV